MVVFWTLSALAAGNELTPVRAGETLESIASARGIDPALLRELNGLDVNAQPRIGDLLALPPPEGDHAEQAVFLTAVRGTVTHQSGDEPAVAAESWNPLPKGAQVCTANDSYATLRLASTCNEEGTEVDDLALDPDTCVVVDSAFSSEKGRASVVTVTRGSVAVRHVPEAGGHVTLRTASGVTTGSDGGYRVTVEESASRTEALQGPVAVQGAGAEVALDAGQGSRVQTGKAPSPAVDLLRAGTLRKPGADVPLRRPAFEWSPVEEAFGYRLEIAADREFQEVVFAESVEDPSFRADTLLLPTGGLRALFWRVASFDRLGFLGIPGEARRVRFPAGVGR